MRNGYRRERCRILIVVRAVVVFVGLSACYAPHPPLAVACGEGGACPSGQVCDLGTNRCARPGDASPADAKADAPVDAPMIDAPVDAPIDAMVDPSGCSDGAREAFVDVQLYPTIAGCAATWVGTLSLRAAPTTVACGDDNGADCGVPADACAAGWHVCGKSGAIAELTVLAADECKNAGPGRFAAGMSHCTNNVDTCEYAATLPCFDEGFCSEPVCCGDGCILPGCSDGVWPAGGTLIAADNGTGCNKFSTDDTSGVMCCKD